MTGFLLDEWSLTGIVILLISPAFAYTDAYSILSCLSWAVQSQSYLHKQKRWKKNEINIILASLLLSKTGLHTRW